MTKHIHIYLGTSTKDDVKHAPAGTSAGGQFTSGGGGSASKTKAPASKAASSVSQAKPKLTEAQRKVKFERANAEIARKIDETQSKHAKSTENAMSRQQAALKVASKK